MAKFQKFGPMRVAFASLDKPQAYKAKDGTEGKPTYSITCLVPKSDKETVKKLKAFAEGAINENGAWKAEKKKQIFNKSFRTSGEDGLNLLCIMRDGDELNKDRVINDKQPYEFFKDAYVVKFKRPASWAAAMIVDRKAQEIPGALVGTMIRPGYWVNVEASAYVFDGQNPGMSLQMQGVQLFKKDEEFGRQNNFEAIEGEDDDETSEESGTFED